MRFVVSIPAHTRETYLAAKLITVDTFQFPHTRETSVAQEAPKAQMFQFPHTRETSVAQEAPKARMFQFPHTRETFPLFQEHLQDDDFNSRTHGKHCNQRIRQ